MNALCLLAVSPCEELLLLKMQCREVLGLPVPRAWEPFPAQVRVSVQVRVCVPARFPLESIAPLLSPSVAALAQLETQYFQLVSSLSLISNEAGAKEKCGGHHDWRFPVS